MRFIVNIYEYNSTYLPTFSVNPTRESKNQIGLALYSSQFAYTSILTRITESWPAKGHVHRKLKERAPFSTVEEHIQQTSIAHSGSPHNALHSLVLCIEEQA